MDLPLLIEKAKDKNEKAFNTLLNSFWSDVYNFQFSKTSNQDEAQDITIKTFAKAFEKIHLYDNKYAFKTWLISISKNLLIDSYRKNKTETISIHKKESEAYKISDDAPSAEDLLINEQNLNRLLNYIKQLKPHHQEIINLRYFHEMSYKEIAEALNEPIGNVKVKLLRAKKILATVISARKNNR
ncbi:MAG: RNA polymerase subunit sigma-70 [Flavobacteriaceae bacterium]|nr:MAG: RNA polymerase subunit sigma-70 [Flavobacteriaceae bacterium]